MLTGVTQGYLQMNPRIYDGHDSVFCRKYGLVGNPINDFGVSAKGMALTFKRRYPDHHEVLQDLSRPNPDKQAGDAYLTVAGVRGLPT